MAHFAKLDENNVVIFVTIGRDEDNGKEAELTAKTGDVYKQTSYNTIGGVHYQSDGTPSIDQSKAFRKNFAGIGYTYLADGPNGEGFVPPSPYPSWTMNSSSYLWEAPVPMPVPNSPPYYKWDENTLSWKDINPPKMDTNMPGAVPNVIG